MLCGSWRARTLPVMAAEIKALGEALQRAVERKTGF
jgi:hypothetical protein